jgi:hypothetical protein
MNEQIQYIAKLAAQYKIYAKHPEQLFIALNELYFEEDFRRAQIEFLKYTDRDFLPSLLESSPRHDKIKINNLKLNDSQLSKLVTPIKAAR